jgi:small GTP-binding protein
MTNNQAFRNEISEIQADLQEALESLKQHCKKLKDKERQEIEQEFDALNELLERLKTGLIWVCVFGKTSVGKSAVINSLLNDDLADVSAEHDKTTEPTVYKKEPWNIIDTPGIMGKEDYEKSALEEVKKAHGHIFVIDGEPYADEIEMFNTVYESSSDIPRIVFVNKWDRIQGKEEREITRSKISEKMGKYVKSSEDIVYGSAMLYNQHTDSMERQEIPHLLDCLYESAGTLGLVMNILDPAKRASEVNDKISERIKNARLKIARKVISSFGTVAAVGIIAPASIVTVYPVLFTTMVYLICKIMGKPVTKISAGKIMWACLKIQGVNGIGGIAFFVFTDAATTALSPLGGLGFALGGLAAIGGTGWYAYSQTVKLGEVTLEYISNDFSWGDREPKEVIEKAKRKVEEIYKKLQPV